MPKRKKKKISKRDARKWLMSAAIITAVILLGAVVGTVIGAVLIGNIVKVIGHFCRLYRLLENSDSCKSEKITP